MTHIATHTATHTAIHAATHTMQHALRHTLQHIKPTHTATLTATQALFLSTRATDGGGGELGGEGDKIKEAQEALLTVDDILGMQFLIV